MWSRGQIIPKVTKGLGGTGLVPKNKPKNNVVLRTTPAITPLAVSNLSRVGTNRRKQVIESVVNPVHSPICFTSSSVRCSNVLKSLVLAILDFVNSIKRNPKMGSDDHIRASQNSLEREVPFCGSRRFLSPFLSRGRS